MCQQQNTRPRRSQASPPPPRTDNSKAPWSLEEARPAASGQTLLRGRRGAGGGVVSARPHRGHTRRAAAAPSHAGHSARSSDATNPLRPRGQLLAPAPTVRGPAPQPAPNGPPPTARRACAHCRLGSHFAGPRAGSDCAGARRRKGRGSVAPAQWAVRGRGRPSADCGGGGLAE